MAKWEKYLIRQILGYITIKDKTTDTVILQPYAVDFKMPYLMVTNYTVINNGKQFDGSKQNSINVPLRGYDNSKSYYQYEKITDQNIINKYKEIKANNGEMNQLQSMLKTTVPTSKWSPWINWSAWTNYWDGYGYPTPTISAPNAGLYYLWVYFSGKDVKDIYGYILVDNLQPEIAVETVSLPKTATVELGKSITLSPTFNPTNATNKIVTWSSSDETVATVDNAGKITPKKMGSTIITVTSQDGNKKATCTVTVAESTGNNQGTNGSTNGGTATTGSSKNDPTIASGKLPETGVGIGIAVSIIVLLASCILGYFKYNRLKGI